MVVILLEGLGCRVGRGLGGGGRGGVVMDGSVVVRGRGFRAARRRRAAAAVIEGDTTRPALTSSDTLHLSDKLRLALVLDLPAAPAPVVVGWAAWARVVVVGWPAMCGKRGWLSLCVALRPEGNYSSSAELESRVMAGL